jgi:hypothetical protein
MSMALTLMNKSLIPMIKVQTLAINDHTLVKNYRALRIKY